MLLTQAFSETLVSGKYVRHNDMVHVRGSLPAAVAHSTK